MNFYKQETILVAEDDAEDALFLKRAFAKVGVPSALHFVQDGQEMVNYLSASEGFADRKAHPFPDLVVLDLKMPRLNGFEVLHWIRSERGLKRLPVIIFTSSAHEDDIKKAYDLGANSYLVKPHALDDLTTLVARLKQYWIESNHAPKAAGV